MTLPALRPLYTKPQFTSSRKRVLPHLSGAQSECGLQEQKEGGVAIQSENLVDPAQKSGGDPVPHRPQDVSFFFQVLSLTLGTSHQKLLGNGRERRHGRSKAKSQPPIPSAKISTIVRTREQTRVSPPPKTPERTRR